MITGRLRRGSSENLFGRVSGSTFDPGRFLGTALLWELLFFALLRQAWVERHAAGPLAKAQETIAHWYGAPVRASIAVTADCSGADVMALCLGVLLAYPVGWRRRLAGMAGALAVILTLNILRIVTLLFASSPQSIQHLHLIVWPIVIVFALALYVSWWMRGGNRHNESSRWRTSRFAAAAACLLALYAATAPWTMTSPLVTQAGVWTVASGAALLQSIGLPASGVGDVLATPRGAFQVTPECLLTPFLPVSLAAIVAMPWSARRRMLAVALALPVFFALGVTRLIALALPAAIVTTPLVIVHGSSARRWNCIDWRRGGCAAPDAAGEWRRAPLEGRLVVRGWHCRRGRHSGRGRQCLDAARDGERRASEPSGDADVDDDAAGRFSGSTRLADLPPRLTRGILDRPHERAPAPSGCDLAVPSCSRGRRDAGADWRGTDPPGRHAACARHPCICHWSAGGAGVAIVRDIRRGR